MGRLIAVIIGCNYRDAPEGQRKLSVLQGAEQDALNVATLLVEKPIHNGHLGGLTLLLGAQATRSSVDTAVQSAIKSVQSQEDTLLFYFSGHGGDGPDGLLLYTSDDEYPGDQLVEQFGWPEYQAAFIFDCCHAADFRDSKSGAFPRMRVRARSIQGGQAGAEGSVPFQALYASLADQRAMEEGKQGRFTSALLEALTQERTPPLLALPLDFEAWKAALPGDLSERHLRVTAGRDALSIEGASELAGDPGFATEQNVGSNAPAPSEDTSASATSTPPFDHAPVGSTEATGQRDALGPISPIEADDFTEMQNPAAQRGF